MTTLDKEKVLAEFTAAYQAAFNKKPDIEEKPGWFSIDGSKNMRLAELQELGQSYSSNKKSAKDSVKSAKKPNSTAVKKPIRAKAKKAKVNKAKTVASEHGETAEHVWLQHIAGKKQRMPRGYRS